MKDQIITNEKQLNDYIDFLRVKLEKDKVIKVSCKNGKQRTLTQNAAIHKYCALLAQEFNGAGYDMQTILAEGTSIPWSEEKVKDDIWRKVQIALLNKKSTTELNTSDVDKVYNVINRYIGQTFGIFVAFPSRHND